MKLHILRCGSMRVSPAVPFGGGISLQNSARELLSPDRKRVELPVFCFLLEHPRGPILVDAGWCRELSPAGVYDPAAVRRGALQPRPGPLPRHPGVLRVAP